MRSRAVIFGRRSEVTCIQSAIEQADRRAAERLLPLVYDELRKLAAEKMAQEKPGQTLEATALVRTHKVGGVVDPHRPLTAMFDCLEGAGGGERLDHRRVHPFREA